VKPADWFLTAAERGNPSTRIDSRHAAGTAWSAGNNVQPLIHGATYFEELEARVAAMKAGDLLLFTDWRGDPDQRLRTTGPAVALSGGRTWTRSRSAPTRTGISARTSRLLAVSACWTCGSVRAARTT
jgi:hypothetical protein